MNIKLRQVIVALVAITVSPLCLMARDFVHIFTSKGIYETCEDLWFKCLLLNDSTMQLSDQAHTAFVEIVNPKDSVVWKAMYPIADGKCDGHVYVGDDWQTGEYRMYVHTASSLGTKDTQLTPKKLLIVGSLPEAQAYVETGHTNEVYVDSFPQGQVRSLNITVELDSAEYHRRSKVRANIKVTDAEGLPVRAAIALSVHDNLYSYRPGDLDLLSHCLAIQNPHQYARVPHEANVLTDGPISGHLRSRKKKEAALAGQLVNVYDYSNTAGNINVVETAEDGSFEVPMDMATSLAWDVLMKPVSSKNLKPVIEISDPFEMISRIRKQGTDTYFPVVRERRPDPMENDTLDYTGRRTVRLNEVVVKGHAGKYPKRNKLLGYLDSISTLTGGAWTCGCCAGHGTTFLNDYVQGYTHHPDGYGWPVKIGVPEKGKSYEIIKYSGGTANDWVEDIQYVEYTGPKQSEEDLLRRAGIYKTKGYCPPHAFMHVDEEELSYLPEDNRNTLTWLPSVNTDENGELSIEFFTSDISSVFNMVGYALSPENHALGELNFKFRVR